MNEEIERLCRDASDEVLVQMFGWYLDMAPDMERKTLSSRISRETAFERKAFIKLFNAI